jgi:hypothetical protein
MPCVDTYTGTVGMVSNEHAVYVTCYFCYMLFNAHLYLYIILLRTGGSGTPLGQRIGDEEVLMGRSFWVRCRCFFWTWWGGGRESVRAGSAGSFFAGRRALLNSPIFYVILYIYGSVGVCFIMFQTISNGDPDPRCPV